MQNPVSQTQSQTTDIFDDIRAGYAFVAERAGHVRINYDRLKSYAMSLPLYAPDNTLDTNHHYISDDAEKLAAAVLTLDAINFGSGYTEALVAGGWKLIDDSIYFTVSTALKKRFDAFGPYTARELAHLGHGDFIELLDLPPDSLAAQEVAALFRPSVNELGEFIEQEFGGSFMRLIAAADGRAARFIEILGTLSGFHDVHIYQGRQIPIFKRAQHVAASLQGFFERIGKTLFTDIDRLTIFPDNAIPHVLRMDGVLQYTPELTVRIDAGENILSGSEEEVELRCCAGEAMERMAAIKGLKVVEMDYTLWHRSVEDPVYATKRAHRTLTRFY